MKIIQITHSILATPQSDYAPALEKLFALTDDGKIFEAVRACRDDAEFTKWYEVNTDKFIHTVN